jgi:glycosyltransferase involved in cell wall biosynthesis
MRILYDGWPLIYAPLGSAAWHLRTLLTLAPEGIEPMLALPTDPQTAAESLKTIFHHTHDRSEWEQRILPRLAAEKRAAAIHTTGLAASLFGKVPTLVSPAELAGPAPTSRWKAALGRGGLARARILWPSDLPESRIPGSILRLPPAVHPEFQAAFASAKTQVSLPEEFVLVHGLPDEASMLALLESWTWAAASIGEFYPLVIAGLNEEARRLVQAQLPEFHVEGSVRVLADVQPQDLAAIYKACIAVVHLGTPAPWGNPLRAALAAGKAVIAHQEPLTEAIVGAAAYLAPPQDLRAFGAAMITVVVDEKAREKLEGAARQRAAHWKVEAFGAGLVEIYREIDKG